MLNKYPIYIVSKGRWDKRLTANALDEMGADYKIIVEKQEFENYANAVGESKVLILPQSYLDEYVTCDELGDD